MTPADPLINLEQVTLTLESRAGKVEILKGIDLVIASGETIAILGPSGSGKSSLMAVMAGIERATGGRVMVDGIDFNRLDEDALALHRRGRFGIVLQSFHLIETMTALENVALPLEIAGRAGAYDRARAELAAVGLSHRLHHHPAELSGGEQQRVAIARALADDPAILFADEPTGNLDAATGREVIELIFRLHRERSTTLLLITHDPVLAERCDRILQMSDGRIFSEESGRRANENG
ncbi:MAG: ATP-binding cassette domain-containing protein [Alphaproteobacteria bacterium]|nr:MAG: ATP-binding cassette domain-containing protein [Alphaproteobacteria bacterium]